MDLLVQFGFDPICPGMWTGKIQRESVADRNLPESDVRPEEKIQTEKSVAELIRCFINVDVPVARIAPSF